MLINEDTIAAISTPQGAGGIAVIRISGSKAIPIVDRIFVSKNGLKTAQSHTALVGHLKDSKTSELIDQVVITIFRNPHSYTGEDVVEISCHGGKYLSSLILEQVIYAGARPAGPGEFTQRAFLNGRMDLAQAESVADLINAKTRESARQAYRGLRGMYSQKINPIRDQLIHLLANLEIELDFAEENISLISSKETMEKMNQAQKEITGLIKTFQKGRMIHDGVRVAIVGKPNVGKSSLFNAIVGFERAIVDETPGTTRDAIEAQIDVDGTLIRLIDTAGLRRSKGKVEKRGIEITEKQIEAADLILFMIDINSGITAADQKIREKILSMDPKPDLKSSRDVVLILNKIDLGEKQIVNKWQENWQRIETSAKYGLGLEDIHQLFYNYLKREAGDDEAQQQVVTNLRHQHALQRANSHLDNAKKSLSQNMSNEFIALDIRASLEAVGEIVGRTTADDILNHIFSKFCIGK